MKLIQQSGSQGISFHITAMNQNSILSKSETSKPEAIPQNKEHNLFSRLDDIRNRVSELNCWDMDYRFFSLHGFWTVGGFLLEVITESPNLAILITFLCPNFKTYALLGASASLFHRTSPGAGGFFVCFHLMPLEI